MGDRAELLRLISLGLSTQGGVGDWCDRQAEWLLEQHDRRELLPAKSICRTCGNATDAEVRNG